MSLIYNEPKQLVPVLVAASVILTGCGLFPSGVYHRVQKGETLWRIATVYEVDLEKLARINHLSDATKIKEGQLLFIPGAKERKETLSYVPQPTQPKTGREEREKPKEEAREVPQVLDFIWPVKGEILAGFGKQDGKRHLGIDIEAEEGTPVLAAFDGLVTYSDDKLRGYGNMVIVKHNEDYSTVYAHNLANLVKEGENVKKGQVIAWVGKTGWASRPHLHFEIREKGKAVNPAFYLP